MILTYMVFHNQFVVYFMLVYFYLHHYHVVCCACRSSTFVLHVYRTIFCCSLIKEKDEIQERNNDLENENTG